jgi:uncharacterized membrane protein
MIESDPLGFAAALAAMTVTVYLSRAGGYWLIGRVTIGPRLRRMLDALPGAVIAASVAPILLHGGGLRAGLSMLAAAATMMVLRNDFAAVLAGVAVAAGAFAFGL